MPDEKKKDAEELNENVLNENCLIGGKEFSKGEAVDFEDEIIDDLKAAGRICKTKAEQETAKGAFKAKKAAEKAAEKEEKK